MRPIVVPWSYGWNVRTASLLVVVGIGNSAYLSRKGVWESDICMYTSNTEALCVLVVFSTETSYQ